MSTAASHATSGEDSCSQRCPRVHARSTRAERALRTTACRARKTAFHTATALRLLASASFAPTPHRAANHAARVSTPPPSATWSALAMAAGATACRAQAPCDAARQRAVLFQRLTVLKKHRCNCHFLFGYLSPRRRAAKRGRPDCIYRVLSLRVASPVSRMGARRSLRRTAITPACPCVSRFEIFYRAFT